MTEDESRLQREVHALKSEVRRLRRIFEGSLIVLAVVAILIIPGLMILVAVAAIGFFGFLASPWGRKTFPDPFHRKV
jgi:Flp pilus assembly protein TadB